MNNKNIAYALIGLGALDIIIWVSNGFSHGYLEFIVGDNLLSQYGAWIMMTVGFYLLNKEKGKEKSEIDQINDLEEGEEIIYKNIGFSTIITLTNKKVIFRAHSLDALIQQSQFHDIVTDEKAIFPYDSIESVITITTKDTSKNAWAGVLNIKQGLQLKLKDGTTKNLIMSSNNDLICAHINKYLNT